MSSVIVWLSIVGASFRIEAGVDVRDGGAETFEHVLDDRITSNPQSILHHLRWQMAITHMPGKAEQVVRVLAAHFVQGFGCRVDANLPSVVEHEVIAIA